MGGGAGINFTLKLNGGHCHWHPKKRAFELTETPTLEKFDVHGYMEGLSNVRGELLKLINFEIQPLDQADSDWCARQGVRARQYLYYRQRDTIEAMIFGGYIRGDIRQAAPAMTFTGEVFIEEYVITPVTFGIAPTEEFYQFYDDVFENWSTNTEHDLQDNEANYAIAA